MQGTHMPNPHLNGKTIVITGASSGFGRGSAEKLAAEGANVVLAARRTNLIEGLADQIAARGGRALAVTTDVSDAKDIALLRDQAVERFGKVDVWINNVGVGALGFFWDIPIEDHARILDVNLKGLIYGAHAALGLFRAQGHGTLVNVGSIDSEVPLAYQASYAGCRSEPEPFAQRGASADEAAGHQGGDDYALGSRYAVVDPRCQLYRP
jgi:NADP-dependent 3-hydroxy acid dehydrogenase YdfG